MQRVICQNWKMVLLSIVFFFLFDESFVQVVGLNSPLPARFNCYTNEQQGCSQEFTDVYPELSRSADNVTLADTYFLLFTRRNPENPEKLHKCGGRLPKNTHFNSENDLIVIMVPYLADFCITAAYREWMPEIFKRGDYNVMVIDWGWGNKIKFEIAVKNMKIAAKQSVIVLKNIQEDQQIKNEQVYLVGHSLASHGLGFIGQDFHVRRITALDPANGGLFNPLEVPPDDRLDSSDADFVDVWHCNAGECSPYFGTAYDIGHVNFWVNDGTNQPGCHINGFKAILKGDVILGTYTTLSSQACSHVLCAEYFRASINPGACQFIGVQCDNYDDFMAGKWERCQENGENCLIMGFDSKDYLNRTFNVPERYYLSTKKTCPYCDNSKTQQEGCKQKEESPVKNASNPHENDAETKQSFLHAIIDFAKWFFVL